MYFIILQNSLDDCQEIFNNNCVVKCYVQTTMGKEMLRMLWESIYSPGLILSSAYSFSCNKSQHNKNKNVLGSVSLSGVVE